MMTVAIWLMLACPYYSNAPGCFTVQFATEQQCKAAGKATEYQSMNVGLRQFRAACIPMEIYNK